MKRNIGASVMQLSYSVYAFVHIVLCSALHAIKKGHFAPFFITAV